MPSELTTTAAAIRKARVEALEEAANIAETYPLMTSAPWNESTRANQRGEQAMKVMIAAVIRARIATLEAANDAR